MQAEQIFEIRILSDANRRFRIMASSPLGKAEELVVAPPKLKVDLVELQKAILRGSIRGGSKHSMSGATSADKSIAEYGDRLFSFLFHSEIETLYRANFERAENEVPQQALRIKLRIDAPELAFVPWEALYDARAHRYLCPSLRTLFQRSADESDEIRGRPPPFRILGMIAQPTEYRGITLDSIDAEQERSEMAGVLEPLEAAGKLTLSWTPSGNWPDFERRFFKPDFAEGWTVFHFIGHGDFDPRQGLGFLLFEEAGSSGGEAVYADDLSLFLNEIPNGRPQLVVLNACNGARSREGDLFSSTAALLASGGVPAVVAMQFPISDEAAKRFSAKFYGSLAEGFPVHQAVARARMELKRLRFSEWISPVLYMRSRDGRVFRESDATC